MYSNASCAGRAVRGEGGNMKYDIAYTDEGYEIEVLYWLKDNAAVGCRVINIPSEEGGYYDCAKLEYFERLYREFPVGRQCQQAKSLEQKINKLEKVLSDLEQKKHEHKVEQKTRAAEYKQFEQLKNLDKFLKAPPEYYVLISSYKYEILKFGDAKCEYHKTKTKLLSLFGKSNGDLEWQLNQYHDGSGNWTTIIPCCSYEEAIEVLRKQLHGRLDLANPSSVITTAAKKYDIALPEKYLQAAHEKRLAALQADIDKHKGALRKAEDALLATEKS